MKETNTCKCPLCEQMFSPENGLTPREHIAKGIIKAYREMQNTQHDLELPCPRCGNKQSKPVMSDNAISRHIDAYICDECSIDELKRNETDNALPFTDWYIVYDILTSIKSNGEN